jgi:hypothetical protein
MQLTHSDRKRLVSVSSIEPIKRETGFKIPFSHSKLYRYILDKLKWEEVRSKYAPSLPTRADVTERREELLALLKSPQKLLGLVKEAATSAGLDQAEGTAKVGLCTSYESILPIACNHLVSNQPLSSIK